MCQQGGIAEEITPGSGFSCLKPSKSPKWIDLEVFTGAETRALQKAVYQLDGDVLKVSSGMGGDRPDSVDPARALEFDRSKAEEGNIDKGRIGASGGRESTRLLCPAVNGAQTTRDLIHPSFFTTEMPRSPRAKWRKRLVVG